MLQIWTVGLTATLIVTAASSIGYLEAWQARALDLLQRLQGHQHPSDVVLVAVDDAVFRALGGRQPIPRDYLARVIRGIAKSGVAAIGVDIRLDMPTTAEADGALAAAIRQFSDGGLSRAVLLGPLGADATALGASALGPHVMLASADILQDADHFIRRVEPVMPGPGGQPAPTLALVVLARVGGFDRRTFEDALRTGSALPLPRLRDGLLHHRSSPPVVARSGLTWPINYVGPEGTFLTIPSDVLAALADPGVEPAADNPLRGRIVLLGGTFEAGRDVYLTPHGSMTGLEVHANIVHMLDTRRFIRRTQWLTGIAINASVVLVAGIVLTVLRPLVGTIICAAGSLLVGIPAAVWAFDRDGYWIDFVLPVVATAFMGIGTDALARRRFRDSFARYLSRDVMAKVLADAPSLRGEQREVSILFSDLRGFTSLSERMAPERIAAHLSEYFDAMTGAIFAHHGMINDFVGDAVMAVFGAPIPDPDHAWNAVRSAIAMNDALTALNRHWETTGLPSLRMGIGIHTGSVFAGNVGGRERLKYTVIGDPVNVASRVEGLNKELGTAILITEKTLAAVDGRVPVRDCGPMGVKGRIEKVRVFEILPSDRSEL